MRRLSLLRRDIDPARIGVGWMPARVSAALGRHRRRLGLYDQATLALLRRARDRQPSPDHWLAYLRFRRDLGQLPSRDEVGQLLAVVGELSRADVRFAVHLALECGLGDAAMAALPRAELLRMAATSPAIADAVYADDRSMPPVARKLARLHRRQDQLRLALADQLGRHAGSICVVGNGSGLVGSGLGARIDAHQVVVRFNHYRSATTRDGDIGRRLDVWVRAPALHGFESPSPEAWVVLSGPDMRYHLRDWSAVTRLADDTRVVTIPLKAWGQLVDQLRAPPSSGVLFLAWAMEMVGGAKHLSVAGFQTQSQPGSSQYHHALPRHVPSTRHHWAGERALLRRWRDDGLVFLD